MARIRRYRPSRRRPFGYRHRRRHRRRYPRFRNPWESAPTGIFDMQTQLLPDDDRIDSTQVDAMMSAASSVIDWDRMARAASVDMPGMRWMYRNALSRAFRDPQVQSEYRNFLKAMIRRAERNLTRRYY